MALSNGGHVHTKKQVGFVLEDHIPRGGENYHLHCYIYIRVASSKRLKKMRKRNRIHSMCKS